MGTQRALLFGWMGMLGFSGTLVATRLTVRELDPTFVALGRAAVAAAMAAAVLRWRRAPWPTRAQLPRPRVSQIQLAQPVFTLLWSALILGERVDPPTVAAALFIVGCVLVTLKTRVRSVGLVPEAP